jgi:CubicO group peptidase (beta-lactamase class C family)
MPLDRFARERIFLPLGMHDTFYLPPDSLKYRIAPTEVGPPRGYSLRGEVHDESAWALGKVAGHAGLFGSATDLAIFAQFLLNRGHYGGVRLVQDATVREFTRHVKDNRTLGWEIAAGERGSGEFLSASAYGHTGYTGTSLWIDPERQLFIVLLTNRAHDPRAKRSGIVIADVRHDVADAAALAIADAPVLSAIAWPRDFRVDQAADWNPPTPTAIRRPTTLPRAASASSPNATLNETQ